MTKYNNFIKSLNNNMHLVEDSSNSVGFIDVATMRDAYIQIFLRDENVTVQQIHDEHLWMCA